jgi:hypothetical protein
MSVSLYGNGNTILQVIQATSTTAVTNNTSTYATTGLSASITPFSTTSKVLVTVTLPIIFGSSNNVIVGVRISRGGTTICTNIFGNSVTAIVQEFLVSNMSFLDSPATASATTYTIQFATLSVSSGYGSTVVMDQSQGTNNGVLILQEISGS